MQKFSGLFKALSNETRFKILKILAKDDRCVTSIAQNFNLSQPTISHHLKVLSGIGLVTRERKSQLVKYRLNRELLATLGTRILRTFSPKNR